MTRTAQVNVLGSRVPVVSLQEAVARTEAFITEPGHRCRQVVNTGFHGIWQGFRDPHYRDVLASADFWVPDGIGIALVARCQRHRAPRIGGPDFVEALLKRAVIKGYRNFFFGDTEETLAALDSVLRVKFPGLQIVGMLSPPFRAVTAEEDQQHMQAINGSGADVLWVGLGCPKQDLWIHEHRDRLRVPVAVGIGAIFRFLGETVPRAPRVVQHIGLEWAWRLLQEPKKCWRRCFIDAPQFLYHVGLELSGAREYPYGTRSRGRARGI